MVRSILNLLADKNGQFRGWRIPAAILVTGAAIGVLISARMNWSPDSLPIFAVLLAIAAILAALFWLEDRFFKPRRQTRPSADPRDPCPSISPATKRVLALLTAPAIVAVMVFMGFKVAREWQSLAWPHALGTVTSISSVREYNFVVTANVAYQVDGKPYTAQLRPNGMDTVKSEAAAKRLTEKFQSGSLHPVYYRPGSPHISSLIRGPTLGAAVATITVPLFGSAVVFAMLRYALRRQPRPSRYATAIAA